MHIIGSTDLVGFDDTGAFMGIAVQYGAVRYSVNAPLHATNVVNANQFAAAFTNTLPNVGETMFPVVDVSKAFKANDIAALQLPTPANAIHRASSNAAMIKTLKRIDYSSNLLGGFTAIGGGAQRKTLPIGLPYNTLVLNIIRKYTRAGPSMVNDLPDGGPRTLHYIDSSKYDEDDMEQDAVPVKEVDVSAIAGRLAIIGKFRFDTVLNRNLVFIVNLYRSVRLKLQRDLVYSKDIILRSEQITRPETTEFHRNQGFIAPKKYNRNNNRFGYET
jgi:hypothetical protein